MSDGNTGNTEKALEDISLETATQTSTVETRKNRLVLQIADVCFEMFSVRELRKPVAVLRELSAAFPEASSKDLQEAIQLAISWRLALRDTRGLIH